MLVSTSNTILLSHIMKITQSIFIFTVFVASILYAKPSSAYECSSSSTITNETNESVSVGNRTRKANFFFTINSSQDEKIACNMRDVADSSIWKFAISDDSTLSSVDVYLYVNGRALGRRKMRRGTTFRFKFTPRTVQDYRFEFKNPTGYGTIYLLE